MIGSNVGQGIGEFILGMFLLCAASVLSWIIYGVYLFYYDNDEFVSDKVLVPEIRLVTDGKVIDSVYVYKLEN